MSNLFGTIWFLAVVGLAVGATPAYLTLYSGVNYDGSSITFTQSVTDFSTTDLDFTALSGCVQGAWFFYQYPDYVNYLASYAGITGIHCFTLFMPIQSAQYIGGSSSDGSACAIAIFTKSEYNGAVNIIQYYPATNYFQVKSDGDTIDYSDYITTFYGYALAGRNSGSCYLAIPSPSGCITAKSYGNDTINKADFSQAATPPGYKIYSSGQCSYGS